MRAWLARRDGSSATPLPPLGSQFGATRTGERRQEASRLEGGTTPEVTGALMGFAIPLRAHAARVTPPAAATWCWRCHAARKHTSWRHEPRRDAIAPNKDRVPFTRAPPSPFAARRCCKMAALAALAAVAAPAAVLYALTLPRCACAEWGQPAQRSCAAAPAPCSPFAPRSRRTAARADGAPRCAAAACVPSCLAPRARAAG